MASDPDPRRTVAASVSPEAAAILRMVGAALAAMPPREPPASLADFDAANARGAAFAEMISPGPLAALAPVVEVGQAGGVPILGVTPRGSWAGAAPLVYVHGGGFVGGSAHANLLTAAVAAATSGRMVYSIDYTLAPRARWDTILDQVAAAWLDVAGRGGPAMGLIGDSAGACIALAASLRLRDRGAVMPAALVVLSPVVDLTGGGDTNTTLAAVDYLDRRMLEPALRAYADPADWANPLVSPIHADFAPGFPPTLIQAGTRETLLSDAVRLHRALRAAGCDARLDLYEGMPHVFQPMLAETPEGRTAWAEMAAFWADHLV
ncbi:MULTISPECIES: alpha/beta hydrolase [unclassified Sphingomonas]|uniref:alpha/beta hydrolase n=1 Tax=unclassified Sphingomonas TaxID=196159 RepID=UPI00226A29DA|nr:MULTISPECIES: alpha/beta hydrolase [unclassified Sphingomonas]